MCKSAVQKRVNQPCLCANKPAAAATTATNAFAAATGSGEPRTLATTAAAAAVGAKAFSSPPPVAEANAVALLRQSQFQRSNADVHDKWMRVSLTLRCIG